MGLKLFGPGGIDQKSNTLLRDPRNLRDALNIRYSSTKEYEKRPGTDTDPTFSGNTYSDVIFIKSLGEYFFRDGANYYSYKNGVKKTIPQTVVSSTTVDTSSISGAEYLNTFIFTHQEGQRGTFKYDGNSVYFAGLPSPAVTISETGAPAAAYVLSFFDFLDAQGNQVFGPSTITQVALDAYSFIQIDTLKDTGFYNGYIIVNGSKTLKADTLGNRTLTYSSKSSDIAVGSKIPFRCSNTGVFSCFITELDGYTIVGLESYIILEIESMTATEIVFKADGFNGKSIALTAASPTNCMGSLVFRYFFSTEETTGYTNGLRMVVDNSLANQQTGSGSIALTGLQLLSDIYDITTSKLRPPKCKYINTYGDQIVCGGVISFFDFKNKENFYTNNDLVMYSDVLTGDLGENFSELNRQLIGDTYDGSITGLIRVRDSLVVFKERSIYALDGILFPKLFSIRKIETNEVGCTSDKSLLVVDGGVLFQGIDGIYAISGNSATKVSGRIDLFFSDEVNPSFNNIVFDSSKTRSVVDNLNESYYFFTNKGVVVFNFEFKEWFLWDLKNAANGLTIDNSNSIRMFSGSSVKKFITTKNDSGAEITAWIKTAWFDFGEPSLLKKFIDIRYFALNNAGQLLSSKIYRDWDESKSRDSIDIDMTNPSTKTILRKIDIQQAQSISLFIGNDYPDENLSLTGFEINGGLIQVLDKNV